jgi:hypothetical protein
MKRIVLMCCLFLMTAKVFGQQFSQYNTGTLFDSFENPSQRSFIPDSSREMAFNFLVPSFNTNFYTTGNAQATLKSRLFSDYYNTAPLQIGKGKNNHLNLNANAYAIMFKLFTNLDGAAEVGFFAGTKGEGRGIFTDESIAVFNGALDFPNNTYNNIFNDSFYYQFYHQIGITYREQVSRKFSFGVKLSALSGIAYRQIKIDRSGIVFDKPNDQATLAVHGTARVSQNLTGGIINEAGLGFQNPGAAITIGTSYKNDDGYHFQYNLKNVGFIHWRGTNAAFNNDTALIRGLSTPQRETNIRNKIDDITTGSAIYNGFTTATNGLAEISVNKDYWLDYDQTLKFSPTLIASKELFYNGFTAALVTPLQYGKYTASLTTAYNDMRLLNMGAQFMIKTPNAEFYIGSDRVYQTASLARAAITSNKSNHVQSLSDQGGSFTGMDFFIGFSFKFGSIIENPMNARSTPDGEKGFIGKLWEKWFHRDKNYD